MTTNSQHSTNEPALIDQLAKVLLPAGAIATAALYLGAQLSSILTRRSLIDGPASETITAAWLALIKHASEPNGAWVDIAGPAMPGPIVYWSSTITVLAFVIVVATKTWQLFTRQTTSLDDRQSLGTDTQARTATKAEINDLIAPKATEGRFAYAVLDGHVLATERQGQNKKRRTIPGPLLVCGPSREGKTTALIQGTNSYPGPALISSVKGDLYHATRAAREKLGEIRVLDPLGVSDAEQAHINPLDWCRTIPGARRIADALLAAAGHGTQGHGKFWNENSAPLLAALMFIAAWSNKTMADVAKWVGTKDQPSDESPGEVATHLKALKTHEKIDQTALAKVDGTLKGIWKTEARLNSSFWVTLGTTVVAWDHDGVCEVTTKTNIDHRWLTRGNNTLYLIQSTTTQAPLAGLFAAVISILMADIENANLYDRFKAQPELLVLLDETANTRLTQLPDWTSIVTGFGIQLVTVWQSFGQVKKNYPDDWRTIIDNARTTLFYSGIKDPETADFISRTAGTSFLENRLRNHKDSGERSGLNVPLIPAHVLRRMKQETVLIITGNFAPIHAQMLNRLPQRYKRSLPQS